MSDPAKVEAAFIAAAREFNAGRYFEAHEELEASLDDVPDDWWNLVLGLIQIAVGYHKATHAYVGGERMLRLGLEKVASYNADALGINLEDLRTRATRDAEDLRLQRFDTDALRRDPPRLKPPRRGSLTAG